MKGIKPICTAICRDAALAFGTVLTSAIALLLAGLILAVSNERAYKAQKIDEVTVEGRFLALIVTAALDFNDRAAAQQYIDAFAAFTGFVRRAGVVKQADFVVATYHELARRVLASGPV